MSSQPVVSSSDPVSGSSSPDQVHTDLNKLLLVAQKEVRTAYEDSRYRLIVVIAICAVALGLSVWLGYELYHYEAYPSEWTWQMIYFTTIRLCIVGAVIALLSFCFNILRSYILIFQRNTHRLTVINIMPGLFAAGLPYMEKEAAYRQVMDILVNFDNTGLLKKDKAIEVPTDIISELLKKAITRNGDE